jgi:flagellar FliJ protein
MARFRFPFEALLTARRQVERERQRAVADFERQRLRIEDSLRRMQAEIAGNRRQLRGELIGTLNAQALRMHAASSIHHMRQAQRLVLELAGLQRNLDASRSALVEAARNRRAIELLRERRLTQWKRLQDKIEDDAIDELAVITAARQRPGRSIGDQRSTVGDMPTSIPKSAL